MESGRGATNGSSHHSHSCLCRAYLVSSASWLLVARASAVTQQHCITSRCISLFVYITQFCAHARDSCGAEKHWYLQKIGVFGGIDSFDLTPDRWVDMIRNCCCGPSLPTSRNVFYTIILMWGDLYAYKAQNRDTATRGWVRVPCVSSLCMQPLQGNW